MTEAVKKVYRKAGVKAPNGKGIHTIRFHKMAAAIKRDNPSYSMSRAYSIAMGKLGAGRAVRKSHRKS